MTRYVIDPDVALALAASAATVRGEHRLLAPTLLRSQVLALLFADVGAGRLTRRDAERQLDHLRRLRIRYLGDRVLQRTAWAVAAEVGWPDTFVAESIALARLQADALVTRTPVVADAARRFVRVATLDELLG